MWVTVKNFDNTTSTLFYKPYGNFDFTSTFESIEFLCPLDFSKNLPLNHGSMWHSVRRPFLSLHVMTIHRGSLSGRNLVLIWTNITTRQNGWLYFNNQNVVPVTPINKFFCRTFLSFLLSFTICSFWNGVINDIITLFTYWKCRYNKRQNLMWWWISMSYTW